MLLQLEIVACSSTIDLWGLDQRLSLQLRSPTGALHVVSMHAPILMLFWHLVKQRRLQEALLDQCCC